MKSADEILICDHMMKTSEQYFPVFRNCYYALPGHSSLSNF